nr:MAG TPA: Chromosome region maintenance protein [Caudoviricetes sp.]DAY98871.1 MAG TPA: Chromosome region maintenance protein [Caudoviricetes sp.]
MSIIYPSKYRMSTQKLELFKICVILSVRR